MQAKEDIADVIIALTEGLVADIAKGIAAKSELETEIRLIGTYVESPLNWAISTGAASSYHDVESLQSGVWGISRFTSGSHLMSLVLAHQRGWKLDLKFEVLGSFESLRNGVNRGDAAAFMWENFTTKPYHDSGEIRRIGEITTPWPCFMMAATKQKLNDPSISVALKRALAAVREACAIFHAEKDSIPALVSERYKLQLADAKAWYSQVKISATPSILQSALSRALATLKEAKVLSDDNTCSPADLIDERFANLEVRDIKNIKLYNRPELITRTYNELKARGWSQGDLDWQKLAEIDQQHHYHGTEAVDAAIEAAKIGKNSNVLSLGSGLGGPARYIAGKTGASVLAIELQADLSQVAQELTERTHLDATVHHMAANFLSAHQHLRLDSYDAIVSWLTVLHISEKHALFKGCNDILAPNGIFYAEDWYRIGEFTTPEKTVLRDDIYCYELPREQEYKTLLEAAGLEILVFEDLTADWKQYAQDRVTAMEARRDSFVSLHGIDIYERLHYFYMRVKDLFNGGALGGARIVARKSSPAKG